MSRIRYSLQELEKKYEEGNKAPLENLVKAWSHLQSLPFDNPDSFFVIGGYHGEPFHGAGTADSNTWWGGYCNHGNVLFPTWHRAYVLRLENALRRVEGCEDVTVPFWDEYAGYDPKLSSKDPKGGIDPRLGPIPVTLTRKTFLIDGKEVPNPFYSFTLPKAMADATSGQNRYDKPAGYTTVRYPLSGLVGTEEDKKETEVYNASFNEDELVPILNDNVKAWLNQGPDIPDRGDGARIPDTYSVGARLQKCLNAPNYMVFSNNGSAAQWIEDYGNDDSHYVVSLESPHNAIHLALGGFYQKAVYNANPPPGLGANGDMGENNTAGLDPIFFFHHCFIDYVFWTWQKKQSKTQPGDLTVDYGYPGTNSSDPSSDPPAGISANVGLDMDTPLYPFKKPDGSWYTSNDVTDIEGQLGYKYGTGSMDPLSAPRLTAPQPVPLSKMIKISGLNRAAYKGSFVIRTYATTKDGQEHEVGRDEVLSRWNVDGCQNCQSHLPIKSFVPIHQAVSDRLRGGGDEEDITYHVRIQGHGTEKEAEGAVLRDIRHGGVRLAIRTR